MLVWPPPQKGKEKAAAGARACKGVSETGEEGGCRMRKRPASRDKHGESGRG